MALNDLLSANFSADVVAVYGPGLQQVMSEARPVRGSYTISSRTMEHPVEDGSVITDHRILLPMKVDLSVIVASDDYRSVISQIENLYMSGTLLTIQARSRTFENMILTDMPFEESPEMYNAVALGLTFSEVKFVSPEFQELPVSSVKNPATSSTKNRGAVKSQPLDDGRTQRGSTARRILKSATGGSQ